MITDNLAPLFGSGPPGVRFRQGTILTWDATTGANTVDLGGGTLTNVPILNTGEAIALKAGHVVGLLGQGSAWFIVGRITPPNDPNFAGASVAFASTAGSVTNFTIPATPTVRGSATLDVPSWADEALVTAWATASVVNTNAARQEVLIGAGINGVTSGEMATGIPPDSGAGGFGFAGLAAVHTAILTSPGPTITVDCQLECTVALAANGFNTAFVNATAVYRSTT